MKSVICDNDGVIPQQRSAPGADRLSIARWSRAALLFHQLPGPDPERFW